MLKEGGVTEDFAAERERMVAQQIAPRGITDQRLLAAMRKVPRHVFFCGPKAGIEAYGDHPVPIGEGQTISQPYMVALMTQYLRLTGSERVLEVGTGSGYQAAILAELAAEVYSVERIAKLAERATETLDRQGYRNVHVKLGDGSLGWPEHAPYDGIIVTAGAPRVPAALTEQLGDGGALVVPVGPRHTQMLTIITRERDKLHRESGTACVFVKLIGDGGWEAEE